MEIHCPNCHADFEGEIWVDGECPFCLECYSWCSGYYPDIDDYIIDVCWY